MKLYLSQHTNPCTALWPLPACWLGWPCVLRRSGYIYGLSRQIGTISQLLATVVVDFHLLFCKKSRDSLLLLGAFFAAYKSIFSTCAPCPEVFWFCGVVAIGISVLLSALGLGGSPDLFHNWNHLPCRRSHFCKSMLCEKLFLAAFCIYPYFPTVNIISGGKKQAWGWFVSQKASTSLNLTCFPLLLGCSLVRRSNP